MIRYIGYLIANIFNIRLIIPNPKNYKIKQTYSQNGFVLAKINYPGCRNYHGDKVILFEGITESDLLKQSYIDPHFIEKNNPKVVARFIPEESGWEMGCYLMEKNNEECLVEKEKSS